MATFIYPSPQTSIVGGATEAKQDSQITLLTSIDGKVATETKQDSQITQLQAVNTELDSQSTTLTSIDGKITAVDTTGKATEAKQDSAITELQSIDTNTASVDTKMDANNTSLSSIDTKMSTNNTSLSNIEADLNDLNARLAGNLVPETFDFLSLTYVTAGNGIGEVETVVYKTGGAAGTTVATLTLAYDANDNLASVTRS